MIRILTGIFALIVIAAFPVRSFCAEAVKLRYVSAAYLDSKGSGMDSPEGVACKDKSIVVADTGHGRLLRYTFEDGAFKGGDAIAIPELLYPERLQINSKGDIFALDGKQHRIVRLSREGAFQGFLAPEGLPGSANVVPTSFRIDKADNIYILDVFSARVLVLDPAGKYVREVAFPEHYGFFVDVAADERGTIFLLDSVEEMIFSASGNAKSFSPFSKNLKEYINLPANIAIGSSGIFYLTDRDGGNIVIVGQDGSFLGYAASFGWKEGLLRYPSQLCINDKDEFFVADRNNDRIQSYAIVK